MGRNNQLSETMFNLSKSEKSEILAILAFSLLTFCLIIISITPPTTGYEISIYDSYPIYVWILIIISILIGEAILLIDINMKNKKWLLGILIMLFSNLILLITPIMRGYEIYGRGDGLSHLGFIKEILITGHIGTTNMYPLDHILVTFSQLLTNGELNLLIMVMPIIFSFLYFPSIYLLSKQFFRKKYLIMIFMTLGMLLLMGTFHGFFAPYAQSLMIVPLFIYIYFKSRVSEQKTKFSILIVILTLMTIFFHPLTTLIIIGIFLVIELSQFLLKRVNERKIDEISSERNGNDNNLRRSTNLFIIALIGFCSWSTYVYLFVENIEKIFNWFVGAPVQSSLFEIYSNSVKSASPDLLTLLSTIFSMYGQNLILGFISLICILYLFKKVNINHLEFKHLFSLTGFSVFFIFSIFTLIQPYSFGYARILPLLLIFSMLTIVTTIELVDVKKLEKNKNILLMGFFILVLFPLTFFSTFNLHYSPIVKSESHQVSKGEIIGMETFFDHRDKSIRIMELGISQLRFYDYNYGLMSRNNLFYIPEQNILYGEKNVNPPNHFNFGNSSVSAGTKYLLVSKLGENYYPEIFKGFEDNWRFKPEDFDKLQSNQTIQKISSNGELTIYLKIS